MDRNFKPNTAKQKINKVINNGIGVKNNKRQSKVINRIAKPIPLKFDTFKSSVLIPELSQNVRVPQQYSQRTLTLHRHISVPLVIDAANSQAAIAWSPNFMHDDATNLDTVAIFNSATFDAVAGTGAGAYSTQTWSIPANQAQSYRVVSASMTIFPQSSTLNQQGKITGFIETINGYAPSASATVINPPQIAKLSIADQAITCTMSNVAVGQGVRLVYTPMDVSDFILQPVNNNKVSANNTLMSNILVFIVTGTQASARFTVEMYINYEYTPFPGSISFGQGIWSTENADPSRVLKEIKSNPQNLSHITTGSTAEAVSNAMKYFNKVDFRPKGTK